MKFFYIKLNYYCSFFKQTTFKNSTKMGMQFNQVYVDIKIIITIYAISK